jgi:hypothetical protein
MDAEAGALKYGVSKSTIHAVAPPRDFRRIGGRGQHGDWRRQLRRYEANFGPSWAAKVRIDRGLEGPETDAGKPLSELGDHECHYPIGHNGGTCRFCGSPIVKGKPYCAVHVAIAYRRPQRA